MAPTLTTFAAPMKSPEAVTGGAASLGAALHEDMAPTLTTFAAPTGGAASLGAALHEA
jgi:hypothetical protein